MGMKLEYVTMEVMRFAHKISGEAVKIVRDTVCVFRIMVFLHSAKDFSSVLKLYGAEDSSL